MSRWDLIFSESFSSTIFPGPIVTAPPTRFMILEPRPAPPAASSKLIAIFKAVPTHLSGRQPYFNGHGSLYRSSRIEFNANSQS